MKNSLTKMLLLQNKMIDNKVNIIKRTKLAKDHLQIIVNYNHSKHKQSKDNYRFKLCKIQLVFHQNKS